MVTSKVNKDAELPHHKIIYASAKHRLRSMWPVKLWDCSIVLESRACVITCSSCQCFANRTKQGAVLYVHMHRTSPKE